MDTGLGVRQIAEAQSEIGFLFRTFVRPKLDLGETAFHQVKKLGFSPSDVRDVILTHLDIDHAGGIPDFPWARIHVSSAEHASAVVSTGKTVPMRFHRYRASLWSHEVNWVNHEAALDTWFNFHGASKLKGLPPEILLIPLPGHTLGHCGVAVKTDSGWLLHAGDSYFFEGEMGFGRARGTLGLNLFQRIFEVDRSARLQHQAKLRTLFESERSIRIFCSHDPLEFKQCIS